LPRWNMSQLRLSQYSFVEYMCLAPWVLLVNLASQGKMGHQALRVRQVHKDRRGRKAKLVLSAPLANQDLRVNKGQQALKAILVL